MKNALSLGTFDGVHIGHRAVLDLPKDHKKTAITFYKPPKSVLSGNEELLMLPEEKVKAIKLLGIDEVKVFHFEDIRDLSAEDFLALIKDEFNPDFISFGFNHRFGKNGTGDAQMLKSFCESNGIKFQMCGAVMFEGEPVSSTLIRSLLKQGKVKVASKLLCTPFSFENEVISGHQRGRRLSFPTINQKYPEGLVKLKFGVYKSLVIVDGREYEGITNIGIRPTFRSDYVISETHIKNFNKDIYGKTVKIVPLEFLREEIKFSSEEELKEQILKDINSI